MCVYEGFGIVTDTNVTETYIIVYQNI